MGDDTFVNQKCSLGSLQFVHLHYSAVFCAGCHHGVVF